MLINGSNNKSIEPSFYIEGEEFNNTVMHLGSFVCMLYNKRLNYIALLSIIMKNAKIKQLYIELTGIDNIYTIIQTIIHNTPSLHKKAAKRSLFQ
jgi:hypothetical protein